MLAISAHELPGRAGRLELRPLDWDSTFFGARMGAIVLARQSSTASLVSELRGLLLDARAARYRHLIFRVSVGDEVAIHAAEYAGLRLVDVALDSIVSFRRLPLPARTWDARIRRACAEDLPSLRELASTAFVLSRFATDPFFTPEQASNLHREWITNLFYGLAQIVLVYEVEDAVRGFVSCALERIEGRIPLIAVAADQRGRGAGRALIATSLQWFAAAGADSVRVKTQANNYPALALYHRSGFTVERAELTYTVTLGPYEADER